MGGRAGWPSTEAALLAAQVALAESAAAARASASWCPTGDLVAGGCFVAAAPAGDPSEPWRCEAFAAAVTWRPDVGRWGEARPRRSDDALRGSTGAPRRARDLGAQVVVRGVLDAPYVPGLLALRHGPLLAEAVAALPGRPDVLLVDATGLDHPRRAGLAVHLGALLDVPTIGVTDRPLAAAGAVPAGRRGACSPLLVDGEVVGFFVRTRDRARVVVAHGGWRTTPAVAAEIVLRTSTGAARTPVPLQEARRVAREARAAAGAGRGR